MNNFSETEEKPDQIKNVITWPDWEYSGYVCRWWLRSDEYSEYSVYFDVIEIDSSLGYNEETKTFENLEYADTFLCGMIKWDGCSHVWFDPKRSYHHLCGRNSWIDFSEMMKRVFDEVAVKIPRFDRQCAGFEP